MAITRGHITIGETGNGTAKLLDLKGVTPKKAISSETSQTSSTDDVKKNRNKNSQKNVPQTTNFPLLPHKTDNDLKSTLSAPERSVPAKQALVLMPLNSHPQETINRAREIRSALLPPANPYPSVRELQLVYKALHMERQALERLKHHLSTRTAKSHRSDLSYPRKPSSRPQKQVTIR